MKNIKEQYAKFAKTKIICHGARATRIGERLIRQVWKYLQSTEFVKGVISENERKEMFDSILLDSLISYPEDIEKLNTNCDIVYQIIMGDDRFEKLDLVTNKLNEIPSITFVIDKKEGEIKNSAYINVEENELLDMFLDLFSVYTFPQEFGADFEELKRFFVMNGEFSAQKGKGINLCVMIKEKREQAFEKEIRDMENEITSYVLVSRIGAKREMRFYSILGEEK